MNPIVLTPRDLAVAAILLLVDAALSVALRLGLTRALGIAAVRMVLQLLFIGYVLQRVFAIASPWLTLGVLLLMTAVAAREVAARPERKLRRYGNEAVGLIAVGFATAIASILALTTALRPAPWYDARYAIPLAGIVLGNVLNAASLALDHLLGGVVREKPAIEAQLCLGATIGQAMAPLRRAAVRRGMLPVINQMSAAGLVTLPGIMTGQILAGLDPIQAVKYQILLMFLLSGGSGLSAVAIVYLAGHRLTDARHRLRLDRLA
ncbi:MAG: iron export ABC transporter permease subunit FetB [Proteobacteria bacterium]|nr:iron export ABC transporter permease subunit FetB [Pseudomonadota bacterium]